MEQVPIVERKNRSDEYLQISPNARVPALKLDDGTIILETVAICRYFETQQPQPPLFGQDGLEQAMVEMWQRKMELELFMPMAMVFRHTHPGMAAFENQFKEYGEAQVKMVDRSLKTLENRLSESPWLAGDNYTIADITAQCGLDFFMRLIRKEIPEDHKATKAWLQQLSDRPSASA